MSIIAAGEGYFEFIVLINAITLAHRHFGSTDFNEKSSRSHTLFRMVTFSLFI